MLTIHMHKDGRVQLIDQEQQPHKTRYVALEEMIEAFRGQAIQSPVLPEGSLQYWRGHGYELVTLYREPHIRTMTLFDDEYQMPVPGLLYAFRIESFGDELPQMGESGVFAVKGRWQDMSTQLCSFPYGNVYEEHTICWGELEFENVKLQQMTGAPDIFLSSPFNDDLGGMYRNPSEDEGQNLREFWEELDGKESFPEDRLVEVCTYSEIKDYLGAVFY